MNNFVFFLCVILVGVAGIAFSAAVNSKKQYDDILQKDVGHLCLDYLKLDSGKYYNGKYDEVE